MRKYNKQTKKIMLVIGGLSLITIIIFSLFLRLAMKVDRKIYDISDGSVLFDSDYNIIKTTSNSYLRSKWGGNYYLKYLDNDYKIGENVVIYLSRSGDIELYGKFYEVFENEEVKTIKGKNEIKSSVSSHFYKLADRKYLIVDRTIEANDSSFVTSNYLLVNLDKLGNATLLNDKSSFKTIKPTVLYTSSYSFDIANEKLNFGNTSVDLKKIIGSTNEYDEETYTLEKKEDSLNNDALNNAGSGNGSGGGSGEGTGAGGGSGDGTGAGNGTGNGVGGSGNGSGSVVGDGTTSGNVSDYNSNYSSLVSDSAVQQIINATKNTSVIRVTSNIGSISIDYVVYDPKNEYKSVYVEVENTETSQVNIVYLSKNDTNITIRDLNPNIFYNLTFKYTYYEKDDLKEYIFDNVGIRTLIPKIDLNVLKITSDKIFYSIDLDKNYTVTGGIINLYVNDEYAEVMSSIPIFGNTNKVSGDNCYLEISSLSLKAEDIITLKIVSIGFDIYELDVGTKYSFKYQEVL